jgi:hypothetical protein
MERKLATLVRPSLGKEVRLCCFILSGVHKHILRCRNSKKRYTRGKEFTMGTFSLDLLVCVRSGMIQCAFSVVITKINMKSSVFWDITRLVPEDRTIHNDCCENPKSCKN